MITSPAVSIPTWRDAPTGPGLWIHVYQEGTPIAVRFRAGHEGKLYAWTNGLVGRPLSEYLDLFEGRWFGPIQEPARATEEPTR
jgi:hypothetical protein